MLDIFLVALQPVHVLIVVFVAVYLVGFGIFLREKEHIVACIMRGKDQREVVGEGKT